MVTGKPKTPPEAGVEHPTKIPEMKLVLRKAQVALDKNPEKMNRHEQNLLILKKFIKIVPKKEGGTERVFFSTSFPLSSDFKEVAKRVKRMARRLAKITLRDWMLTWEDLEGKLEDDDYEAFKESIFKSFAKFILSIYDTEDLERYCSRNQLDVEYKKFYSEKLYPLEHDENPYKLIAEGKIKFDGFPSLAEHDVGFIISIYLLNRKLVQGKALANFLPGVRLMDFGVTSYDAACFKGKKSNHRNFREIARTVMLHYVPVKLWNMSFAVTDGVRDGRYGSFADEVIDLVNIADGRRRFQGHHYISNHHILWAVGLTGIKDLVDKLIEGIGLSKLVK
ncbi:hypothetical protein REPUB_Repub16aG0132500 [Reevesia pubescens]